MSRLSNGRVQCTGSTFGGKPNRRCLAMMTPRSVVTTTGIGLLVVLYAAVIVGIGIVVIHFVTKYW